MTPDLTRILYVEDDPSFLDLAATHLERSGDSFSVIQKQSASDGLACLRDRDVDCVVSDYEMPEMDGLEFLDAVRAEYSALPFILHTGKGSEEIASKAINAGVDGYYQKAGGPGHFTVIARHITTLVEKYRAEQRLEHLERARHIGDGGTLVSAPSSQSERSDPVSMKVVGAVAAREGVDPVALTPPLNECIDPDALDALFPQSPPDAETSAQSVTFTYRGYSVTVSGDGDVAVEE